MEEVRLIMIIAILGVAIYVALSPNIVYAPQPRVVLYFLLSVLFAILLGAEAVAQLKLEFLGFALVSSGAAAVSFAMLFLLNHLSKPEEKIAVFYIVDECDNPVDLQWKGAFEVPLTANGLTVTHLIAYNAVVFIFPSQVENAEIRVRTSRASRQFKGTATYAGSRSMYLKIGRDLT